MNDNKIKIEITSRDLTMLMIGLERQVDSIKNDGFNPLLEDNKRLLKKLIEIKKSYITNYLYKKKR